MEILCPNCKQTADSHTIDGADYINCPECGWFEVRADSTFVACDDPSATKPDQPAEPEQPAAKQITHGAGPASTSEGDQPNSTPVPADDAIAPSDKPGLIDDEDDDEVNVRVTFED